MLDTQGRITYSLPSKKGLLITNTKNWWPGKHVLVSPQWIERVIWDESKVFVNLSTKIIKRSPEYRPETLNRDYETELHRHYDRKEYWTD